MKITRHFNYKLALPGFENRDFGCTVEDEVSADSGNTIEEHRDFKSSQLHKFCKEEVEKSVKQYKAELEREKNKKQLKVELKDKELDSAWRDVDADSAEAINEE